MANKKIIVSSGDGAFQETTSSFSVDNENSIFSVYSAVIATSSLQSNISGLLQVYNGKVMPVWLTSSVWENYDDDNDQLTNLDPSFNKGNLSGTLFQYRNDLQIIDNKDYNGFGPHRVTSASFNGDIIGTISSSAPVKVISIANVTGGILDSRFGGTSTGSYDINSIVTLSGGIFNPPAATNNVIITDNNSNWSLATKTFINPGFTQLLQPDIYLYTGSIAPNTNASGSTFTWNKPSNARFIRVICQGAGGGGGAAGTVGSQYGGGGGGGGGYCDVTFNASAITPTVSVVVGAGGLGVGGVANLGGTGGSSSFGEYIYSAGGARGDQGNNATPTVAAGGVGYNYLGGTGTTANVGAVTLSDVYLGGAGGGSGYGGGNSKRGGNITYLSINGGTAGIGGTTPTNAGDPASGSIFNFPSASINNSLNPQPFPFLIYGGGGGGGGSGTSGVSGKNGSSPFFGSGGGGAGRAGGSATNGIGGNGGRGYVLIICT